MGLTLHLIIVCKNLTMSFNSVNLVGEVDMPELDRFEKTLRPGWRVAYRYSREGIATKEEIGDKLIKTLAKTLREGEGLPGLHAMVAVVAGTREDSLLDAFEALDDIVREHSGHRHTTIAAEVIKSLLIQQASAIGVLAFEDLALQLSIAVCSALVDHYFFANARQYLVAEGIIASPEEARQWQDRMEQLIQPAIDKIASHIGFTPDAKGLRAPRRMAKKKSTSSLLEEELLPSPRRI